MRRLLLVISALLLLVVPALAQGLDTDNDGLTDAMERVLGTDPSYAEKLEQIGTDKTKDQGDNVGKDNYAPGLDLVAVSLGHVAEDRYLWRFDFLGDYDPSNSGVIVYLYADDDPKTGRSDMGCEYMVVCSKGTGTVRTFAPNGVETPGVCRAAWAGRSLYLCADLNLRQVEGKIVGTYSVLHETQEPHTMVDAISPTKFALSSVSTRQKVTMPEDETQSRGMQVTWGFRALENIKQDKANVLLPSWEGELQGYELNIQTEYVNRHVKQTARPPYTVTVTVPRAGKYRVGFFTYQAGGRQNMVVRLNGKEIGLAASTEGNKRQCLFFTEQPQALKAGDRIQLENVCGRELVEEVILLPQAPPLVKLERKLTDLQARPALALDGRLVGEVTFITTWPALCTVTAEGQTPQTDPEPLANHRFWLADVKPGQTYKVTVETQTPEGEAVKQQTSFTAAIQPPKGTVARAALPLTCENQYANELKGWPVTQGLPFPQGALVSADNLRLMNSAGQEIPLQVTVLGYWPDYSIKWALLDFQTDLAARQTAKFMLQYGTAVKRQAVARPIAISETEQAVTVDAGAIKVELSRTQPSFMGRIWLDRNGDGRFDNSELVSGQGLGASKVAMGGKTGVAQAPTVKIMRRGPLHVIVRVDGANKVDKADFGDQVDLHFYAGKPYVVTNHTFTNTNTTQGFTNLDSLYLSRDLNLGGNVKARFGAEGEAAAPDAGGATLWQGFDDQYKVTGLGAARTGKRAANWADASGDNAGVTVAVRYLWQLYPKSITVRSDGIDLGIMPKFAPGTYKVSKEGELEDKLYYYLKDDAYRLKLGVSKRHELLWAFHAPGAAPAIAEATAFDEPPVLKADKNWYCDSKAFGDILASTPELGGIFAAYEKATAQAVSDFLNSREKGREYGMLNFGDWWGERGRNWGNIEYDTQYAFYLQFVRSGDERYFRLGEQASRHNHDVDMIWAGDPHQIGKVYAHCIGHTGNYYSHDINGQGSPGGGTTVTHSWCEGYLADYFLSGDVRGLESASLLTDNYDAYYTTNYDWDICRTNGWHLIMTMGMYRATSDPFYLNAAKIILQRTREREDPGGGWIREMMPGHCYCLPRHRGEAGFMLGILLSGLRDYNQVARDPAVDTMITRAAHFMIREMWVPEKKTMRYTSCPVSSAGGGLSELETEGLMHGYMHQPDKILGEVCKLGTVISIKAVSGFGKSFTQQIRRTPAILYQFAQQDLDNFNFSPGQSVRMLLKQTNDRGLTVTLRPRGEGQIGGKATLLSGDKVLAEVALDQRPSVMMQLPAGTPVGLYTLKVDPAGQVPWDVDSDVEKQIVDCSQPVRFGPGVKIPSYMVFLPSAGKTTFAIKGLGKGGYAARLRPLYGKVQPVQVSFKGSGKIVADAAKRQTGLYELTLTQCPGAFELQIRGTLPYLGYWPSNVFSPGEPLPNMTIQGSLGPGSNGEVTFDATSTTDTDDDITQYEWDFGDGQKAPGPVVKHRWAKSGGYVVTLTVSDKRGTSAALKRPVHVPPQWVMALDPKQSVVLEAEAFTGQGKGEVAVTQRVGCNGSMVTKWESTLGHWLEWKFALPQAGKYNVVLRYCTQSVDTRRELTVDGQAAGPGFEEVRLASTGGDSTDVDQWQYHRVPATPGGSTDTPAVLNLTAGTHTLRLSNTGGGLGLDQVLIVPAQ